MSKAMLWPRPNWRDWSVPRFTRRMARRHPELERQVLWPDVVRICEREGILLRRVPISDEGRLIRFGQHVCIQLRKTLDEKASTIFAMHELCHFWRDDPGEPCYYADAHSTDPREEFCDIFAWYVTMPDRPKLTESRYRVDGLRGEEL